MRHGAEVLAEICQSAFARLIQRGGAAAHSLFNPQEREKLADALAIVRGTSELLGRSMIRDWQRQALAEGPDAPIPASESLDGSYPSPLAVPVCRQDTNYSCGAAALQAVLAFHGIAENEAAIAKTLGTDPVGGTGSDAIIALVKQLGLPMEDRDGLSLDDLAHCLAKGAPILCPIQLHGGGHWVVVRGLDELGVSIMDPVDGETSIGRDAFQAAWKDKDAAGKVYEQYGIAVGPRVVGQPGPGGERDAASRESILLREELTDGVPLLTPEAALRYFLGLTPEIGVDPGVFFADLRRTAFTLAVATDTELLGTVQGLIAEVLRSGDTVTVAPRMIQDLLDGAGVSPRNPQYAEMVFRTNAMDSYVRGSVDEMRDPDVMEAFPVWRYSNPHDSRSRPEHAARNGNYYPNATEFTEVRGTGPEDVCNCRCVPIPINKFQWRRLQAQGARLADGYALEALDLREVKDASGHEHAADGKFGSGGAASTTGAQAKKKAKKIEAGKTVAETPAQAEHKAGRMAVVKEAVAGLKTAGVKVKSVASRIGQAVWNKMPAKAQKAAKITYGVGHYVLHKAESAMRGGKALALEVAKQRGLPAAHVEKVGRVLGIADTVAAWTVNMPATLAATGSVKLAKAASFLPLASAAYIAYSTARNPFAVARVAKAAISGKLMKTAHEALDAGEHKEELVAMLLERMGANGGSDWYLALLHAALDECGQDMAEAIKMADAAFARQKEGPK